VRASYEVAVSQLAQASDYNLPIFISEFNCFTSSTTENISQAYFVGRDIMDQPATAACVAAQVAGIVTRPNGPQRISLHKMVQNLTPTSPSGVGKTGLLYANTASAPFYIDSSSKTGEAYRLILRKGIGRQVMGFGSAPWNISATTSRVRGHWMPEHVSVIDGESKLILYGSHVAMH